MRFLVFALTAWVLSATAQAQSLEHIYKNAQSFVNQSRNPDPRNTEGVWRAGEFLGYVSGLLDSNRFLAETADQRLSACADVADRKRIVHAVAATMLSRPLDGYPPKFPVLSVGLVLQLVCADVVGAEAKGGAKPK